MLFRGLAVIAEKEAELRDKVKRELFMPKVTLTCALPFALIFLPGSGAPIAASILAAALLGAFALVLIAEQFALRLDGRANRWTQAVVARTPYLGCLATAIATIRFARTAAMLYSAGIVFSRAIEIAADTCGNSKLRERVRPAVQRLEGGSSATEALADAGIFPPAFAAAFRTGDATGNADKLLESVADFCDQDVAVALHQFSVMIGVAALLIVGVLVGLIAVTFYGAVKG
jgi:type II secretory pathway component PulF